jgi:hypothetical protein
MAGNKKPLPQNLDGTRFRPLFASTSEKNFIRKKDELVFHYFGKTHSPIRVGDYKMIKFWNLKKVELYNLKNYLVELNDLSTIEPKIIA